MRRPAVEGRAMRRMTAGGLGRDRGGGRCGQARASSGGRRDGDRLAGGQLHLRRGRALAGQRLANRSGPARAPIAPPSTATAWGSAITTRPASTAPPRRTAATAPTWRRSSAPRCAVEREGEPRLLGGAGGERLASGARAAGRTSASRRRRTSWRRWRGATTCGWSSSPSAPTTSASATWWPVRARLGAQLAEDDPALCRGDAQAESRRRCPPMRAGAGAGRCAGCERRWRMPATGARTTGW